MFMKQVETITQALAKSEAMAFAEWIRTSNIMPNIDGGTWLTDFPDPEPYTTEQLYSLFKESQQ